MAHLAHLLQWFTQLRRFFPIANSLKVAEAKLGDVHQNHLGWCCQGDVEKCCGASNFEVGYGIYGTNIYQQHLFQRGGPINLRADGTLPPNHHEGSKSP